MNSENMALPPRASMMLSAEDQGTDGTDSLDAPIAYSPGSCGVSCQVKTCSPQVSMPSGSPVYSQAGFMQTGGLAAPAAYGAGHTVSWGAPVDVVPAHPPYMYSSDIMPGAVAGGDCPGQAQVPGSMLCKLRQVRSQVVSTVLQERLQEDLVVSALNKVGHALLNKELQSALVPLLTANLCTLSGILKTKEGDCHVRLEQRLALRPSKHLLERIESVSKLRDVFASSIRSGETTPEEMVMLALLGQELTCEDRQLYNPNAALTCALKDTLHQRLSVDLQNPETQYIIFKRLNELEMRLSPATGKDIAWLNDAIEKNLTFFNNVYLDRVEEAIDRFAKAVAARTVNPQQTEEQIKGLFSYELIRCENFGVMLMGLSLMKQHIPQLQNCHLVYELVKAVVTAESVGLEKLLEGVTDYGSDEIQKAAKIFAGVVSEREAKRAFATLLNNLGEGVIRKQCIDTALETMNFHPGDFSGSAESTAVGVKVASHLPVRDKAPVAASVQVAEQPQISGTAVSSTEYGVLLHYHSDFVKLFSSAQPLSLLCGKLWTLGIVKEKDEYSQFTEEENSSLCKSDEKAQRNACRLMQTLLSTVEGEAGQFDAIVRAVSGAGGRPFRLLAEDMKKAVRQK